MRGEKLAGRGVSGAGQLQRAGERLRSRGMHVAVLLAKREQLCDPVGDEGGARLALAGGKRAAADVKRRFGKREYVINEIEFAVELVVAAGELDVERAQLAALGVGEHAGPVGNARQTLVGRAQHEQMADAAPPHAVKVSGGHAVERHGDRADVVLREHPAEEPPKILLRERHVAENGVALLKRGNDQLPELTVFRRGLKLSGLLERERVLFQVLRQRNILPERRERGALSARVGRFFSAALERRERRGDAPAQRVDLCKERVALRRDLAAEAVRVLPPGFLARPCRAAQRPEKDVVFQRVAVGAGNAGQTGFQIGENALVAPAVGKNIECRGDERRKGTGENVGSLA